MAESKIKYEGISTLEVLSEARNYNQWIADEIKRHISGSMLEIGAGTGNLSTYFLDSSRAFCISEKDQGLVKILRDKFKKNKNVIVRKVDIETRIPSFFKNAFVSIYGVNVLEHIEKDELALKNLHKMLKTNGRLVLLVPAKQIAYTNLDKELGHFRRYEKKELTDKLIRCGYEIEKIYYFNIVGLLSWYVRGKVKKKNFQLKPYHIRMFDSIVPFLRVIESIKRPPLGISLIVVVKKK